jgi:hypothetical protein
MDTPTNNSAENPQTSEKKRNLHNRKRVTPFWTDTILVIFLLFMILLDYQMISPYGHEPNKEAEVKSSLHAIQVAVERYAVDHGGQYPPYLIGGQGKYSQFVDGEVGKFKNVKDCPDRSLLSDPLLREGYLDAYPINPFATNAAAIHNYQGKVKDPLQNGEEEAILSGTRFGPYCTLMGNVMADKRYTEFTVRDDKGVEHTYLTFADVDYPFYDLWETNKPNPFIPGEFFYRSRSVKVIVNGVAHDEVQDYMLGGYGAIRTKGKDVIGPDPIGVNDVTPFGVAPNMYGNPNGIRDSIILVLVPAEDVPPKPKAE